jgi:tRNA A-37 threonylcarbamoyl transferase component Bud32
LDDREHGRWLSGEPVVFSNGALGTETSVGRTFLDYRLEEPIGQGGMGVVYVANDARLKRKVALKLMAPELASDERFRERFVRESELAMSLEHANVVPIYDAGEADGRLYLAMRRVEGSDLRALLRNAGALAPPRAVAIARQIAHALDAAHAKGLVHRDVKPSNVLLDESEHVYLADFGLTRRQSEDGAQPGDGRSLGTPAYLAPEQLEGGPIDGRADVYSLGCLLYECLTGEPPFGGKSRLEVAWAHLEDEPPRASERNSALPAAIDDVIRKAMAKHPDDRYATCAELVAAAEAALGLQQPAASRRRRLLLAAAAVVAAVTALAATLVGVFGARAGGEAAPVDRNTLVRIDPTTNEIAAVVEVGNRPGAVAAAGGSVWTYNLEDRTVSEVDVRTSDVRATTKVPTIPYGGPDGASLLAADSAGAWVAGHVPTTGAPVLTRIPRGGEGVRQYRLGASVLEVVSGGGAVWVLGRGLALGRVQLIRVDRRTGAVTRRLSPSGLLGDVGGLTLGGGFLWLVANGVLYRIDPASGDVRSVDLGHFALQPVYGMGFLWLCAGTGDDAEMMRVDPRTLRAEPAGKGLPKEEGGTYGAGLGSVWRLDVPTGTLMRFDPKTRDLAGLVRISDGRESGKGGLDIKSIVPGGEALWVAIA